KTRKTKPPALLVSVPSSLNPPFNMEIESVTSASIKGEFFNRIGSFLPLAAFCTKVRTEYR
ncbi:hypothetical protein WG622_07430, partial [Cognatishimia sp. D5M38]